MEFNERDSADKLSVPLTTDVCIIGAGPAGLTASLFLTRHNISHYLLDSESFPRHKPCGDNITSQAISVLEEIDSEFVPSLLQNKVLNPIHKMVLYAPNGKGINLEYLPYKMQEDQPSCYATSRYDFDLALLKKVEESHFAVVKQNCFVNGLKYGDNHISISTNTHLNLNAKMVIVATGSNNSVLKLLSCPFPEKDAAIGIRAYYKNIEGPVDTAQLFLEKEIMPGGFYITPLSGNIFNVNLVLFLKDVKRKKINIRKLFEERIALNPMLKDRFKNATRVGNFEGMKLHMGVKKRVVSYDRVLIAGDSAGLIDIISGNGIPQAMISGKMAALQTIEALKTANYSKEFLSKYDKELYSKVDKSLSLGKVFYPFLQFKFICVLNLHLLNYLAKRPQTNNILRDLLYVKNPKARLLNPKFYFDLLIR